MPRVPVGRVNFVQSLLVNGNCGVSSRISVRLRERKLGGIFVSYRRSDSQGEAGRLFDDLVKHFDEHTVFMDVSAIEAGRDFRKAIEEAVTKCGVLLVVMGPEWLNAKDERGTRRLDDPADFVRIETSAALRRDIPVIPVLVRAAKMPSAENLPDDLKELAFRNCMELTHARWKSDIQLLIEALRRLLGDAIQPGTVVRVNAAAASAQTTQQEATGTLKRVDGSSARVDPAILQQISRELALRIGPIAAIVVKRAAAQCASVEDLYLKVAEEIDSREERSNFLQGRSTISSSVLPDTALVAIPSSQKVEASDLPPRRERDVAALKRFSPATEMRLSGRAKYLVLIGAGVIVLVLAVVVAMRFEKPDATPPAQTSPLEKQEEPAPVKRDTQSALAQGAAIATRVAPETESKLPQRVRVPEGVSRELLLTKVLPVYPLLARQAHVQGTVVLDADVSKDGAVERLKEVSGHPMLIPAAIDAVKQWRYKPYLLKGEPVAMDTQVIVNFTLSSR
jgi:TonB family protein